MDLTLDHLLWGSRVSPSPSIQRDKINSYPLYWRGACTHAMTLHANMPYKNIFHDTYTVKQARGEAGEKGDRLNRPNGPTTPTRAYPPPGGGGLETENTRDSARPPPPLG